MKGARAKALTRVTAQISIPRFGAEITERIEGELGGISASPNSRMGCLMVKNDDHPEPPEIIRFS